MLTLTLITAAAVAIILILDWLRKGLAQFLKDEAGEVANGDHRTAALLNQVIDGEGLRAAARSETLGPGGVSLNEQQPSGTQHNQHALLTRPSRGTGGI